MPLAGKSFTQLIVLEFVQSMKFMTEAPLYTNHYLSTPEPGDKAGKVILSYLSKPLQKN